MNLTNDFISFIIKISYDPSIKFRIILSEVEV